MPAHKKDQVATAMIELYDQGLSLSQIGAIFLVTRQSVFRMLKRRKHPLRTMKPCETVTWNGQTYSNRANGYFAKTTGDRAYLHREVYQDTHGEIPPDFDVHHLDGDKTHNAAENLCAQSPSEHGKRHGFGGNQYTGSLGSRPVKW